MFSFFYTMPLRSQDEHIKNLVEYTDGNYSPGREYPNIIGSIQATAYRAMKCKAFLSNMPQVCVMTVLNR